MARDFLCEHRWLKKLVLSNGRVLPHRVMPGPMHGVMNPLFCRVANELDIFDYWITPFVQLSTASPKLKTLARKISIYSSGLQCDCDLIVQLLGSRSQVIAETASKLRALKVTGVNLNFACPSRKVISSGNGGALLKEASRLEEIILAVKEKVPDLSISVKVRSGFSSPDDMEEFLPIISHLPIDFVMFHFRTVLEGYDLVSDRIARICRAVDLASPLALIASGDVFSIEDALEVSDLTNCSGICIARGLMKNPFMPLMLKRVLGGRTPEKYISEIFYEKMLEISRLHPEYGGRSSFIEITRMMYGVDSLRFKKLINC